MERKRFFDLCQQAAAFPDQKIQVNFAGHNYTPDAYQLRFDNAGHGIHSAILIDPERNCIMNAKLDAVEEAIKTDA